MNSDDILLNIEMHFAQGRTVLTSKEFYRLLHGEKDKAQKTLFEVKE